MKKNPRVFKLVKNQDNSVTAFNHLGNAVLQFEISPGLIRMFNGDPFMHIKGDLNQEAKLLTIHKRVKK